MDLMVLELMQSPYLPQLLADRKAVLEIYFPTGWNVEAITAFTNRHKLRRAAWHQIEKRFFTVVYQNEA